MRITVFGAAGSVGSRVVTEALARGRADACHTTRYRRRRELVAAFQPYLTQAEGIRLDAQTFDKDVSKLSCCA